MEPRESPPLAETPDIYGAYPRLSDAAPVAALRNWLIEALSAGSARRHDDDIRGYGPHVAAIRQVRPHTNGPRRMSAARHTGVHLRLC